MINLSRCFRRLFTSRLAKPACAAIAAVILPASARAQSASAPALPSWGISIWGASYHVDRQIDYTERNWGLGVRYYMRPNWTWLGKNPQNRLFLEGDALRNSNRGLTMPVSAGVEFQIGPSWGHCRLFGVGMLVAAYYENERKDTHQIQVGPVPGLTIGCGPVRLNGIGIIRPARQPLAAIVSSITILF